MMNLILSGATSILFNTSSISSSTIGSYVEEMSSNLAFGAYCAQFLDSPRSKSAKEPVGACRIKETIIGCLFLLNPFVSVDLKTIRRGRKRTCGFHPPDEESSTRESRCSQARMT